MREGQHSADPNRSLFHGDLSLAKLFEPMWGRLLFAAMARRYHFNLRDGRDEPDLTGVELTSVEAAQQHAVAFVAEVMRDKGAALWQDDEWHLEVTDEAGLILFELAVLATRAPSLIQPIQQ